MSYLVFARKYRPATFAEVSGQEHITRTLANAIKRDKIAHAFLFCGPRGVGKTSVARILSKSLNCKKGPTAEPCGKCTNCREVSEGTSLAVREIDGASHNSVDNVRDLIDSFRALPAPGYRYKVYIIDEVHMLSVSAFNALLKSLEEPPPHTVFILATTEVHKIPETVLSRCQQHLFRALGVESIEERLGFIANEEKLKIEDGVLRMVASLSDGSMRDAQSLLDKLQLFCDGKIRVIDASRLLGAAEKNKLFLLSEAIFGRDAQRSLKIIAECFETGVDTSLLIKDFMAHWRELLLAQIGGADMLCEIGVAADHAERMCKQVEGVSKPRMQRLVQLAREGADSALRSAFPKYALEALLVRMALLDDAGGSQGLRSLPEGSESLKSKRADGAALGGAVNAPVRAAQGGGQEVSSEKSQPKKKLYEWKSFVQFVSQNGSKFLYEHLKRVSVVEFSQLFLHLRGPEFSMTYMQRAEEKKGLIALLESFSKESGWVLKFEAGSLKGGAEEGSLLHVEKLQAQSWQQAKHRDISAHPKIQTLRKIFPGSEIEDIKIKET